MSRGFVKEDDLEHAGTDIPERPVSQHPNYVTPLGLQEGASKVAAHEGIVLVQLHPESTTTEYMMRFLDQVCVGLEERIHVTESLTITVTDKDGNVIERRQVDA